MYAFMTYFCAVKQRLDVCPKLSLLISLLKKFCVHNLKRNMCSMKLFGAKQLMHHHLRHFMLDVPWSSNRRDVSSSHEHSHQQISMLGILEVKLILVNKVL